MRGGDQPHTDMTGGDLDTMDLTDKQWMLGADARRYPVILETRGRAITAASMARKGWGAVEDGASGQRIFRLSQEGCDAFAWLDDLDDFTPPGWTPFDEAPA